MSVGADDPWVNITIDGKYKILEKINDGGMGAVYKAQHTLMDRVVALKVLRPELIDHNSEEFLERFKQEAKTASTIQHPNAIIIHDYGVHEDSPYLVMQLIDGVSLGFLIEEHGPMPIPRIATIMKQVCGAISEAHAAGIVHRDLKPDNIMISTRRDGSDQVVVLDFGIAKIIGRAGNSLNSMTQTGMIVGTPKYMSPEQIQGLEIDGRSDIYSLGAILYVMLSGEEPHQAESPMHLMVKCLNDDPIPLSNHRADIPKDIAAVTMKALAKSVDLRYQSAQEFNDDLQRAALGQEVTASQRAAALASEPEPKKKDSFTLGDSNNVSWDKENRPPVRRRSTSFGSKTALNGLAVLAILAGTVYWLILPPKKATPPLSSENSVNSLVKPEPPVVASLPEEEAAATAELEAELAAVAEQAKPQTVEELVQVFHSTDRDERVAAADELVKRGDESLESLILGLKDKDSKVRFWSANALGRLKNEKAVDPLIDRLDDPSDAVYDSVVGALKRIGSDEALAALKVLQENPASTAGSLREPGVGTTTLDPEALKMAREALSGSDTGVQATTASTEAQPVQTNGTTTALGVAEGASGSSTDAESSYRDILSEAQTAVKSRSYQKAATLYEQAAGLRPKDAFVQERLGWVYNKLGRYDGAVTALQKAAELNPDSTTALLNLGNAFLKSNRYKDAIPVLTKAIERDPNNASSQLTVANAYNMIRDYQSAITHFKEAARLEPTKASTHYGLAYANQRLGQLDAAIAAYRESLSLEPGFAKAQAALGKALLDARKYDEAIAELEKAVQLDSSNARIQNDLGFAYERSGKSKNAAEAYGAALRLEPQNSQYKANLERVN